MAGLDPSGVLCEILDDSGDRASRAELVEIAYKFDLPIITIEQLIRYRRQREQLVERLAAARLPTRFGEFQVIAYGVKYESPQPIVLFMGDLAKANAPWSACTRPVLRATCSPPAL